MNPKRLKRVAVTGLGIVTSIGTSLPAFARGLFDGACGIGPISLFDTEGFPSRLGGEVPIGDLGAALAGRSARRASRCDLLGLMAVREAWADAGLDAAGIDPGRSAVILGGGAGGMLAWEKHQRTLRSGTRRAHPSPLLAAAPCTLTDLVADRYRLAGPRTTITTACSSSATSIGYGFDLIRTGAQRMVVTGGSEALSELTFAGFNALRVMSPERCRPFDRDRKGLSLGEGAAILILEEFEHAERRGAALRAEVLGYAVNADAYHMTSPDPEAQGMQRVMALALARAGVAPDRVGYVNAHGTGTRVNDEMEAVAIQKVFAAVDTPPAVSSTKSMVGHCLGASGAIEAAATILAIERQTAPPTVGLQVPDPRCALAHVPRRACRRDIAVALSNSFAFGGNNTALLFGRAG